MNDLEMAKATLRYCAEVLVYGADNRDIDRAQRAISGRNPPVTLTDFRKRCNAIPGYHETSSDPREAVAKILRQGRDVAGVGVGNCGEQANVAFEYLVGQCRHPGVALYTLFSDIEKDEDPARALEVKQLEHPASEARRSLKAPNFGHSFVVLGLDRHPMHIQYLYRASEWLPADWHRAVWCDPWAREAFDVRSDWWRAKDILEGLKEAEIALEEKAILMVCVAYYDGQKLD